MSEGKTEAKRIGEYLVGSESAKQKKHSDRALLER